MKNVSNEQMMHFNVENYNDNKMNVKCNLTSCSMQFLMNLNEKNVVIKVII